MDPCGCMWLLTSDGHFYMYVLSFLLVVIVCRGSFFFKVLFVEFEYVIRGCDLRYVCE